MRRAGLLAVFMLAVLAISAGAVTYTMIDDFSTANPYRKLIGNVQIVSGAAYFNGTLGLDGTLEYFFTDKYINLTNGNLSEVLSFVVRDLTAISTMTIKLVQTDSQGLVIQQVSIPVDVGNSQHPLTVGDIIKVRVTEINGSYSFEVICLDTSGTTWSYGSASFTPSSGEFKPNDVRITVSLPDNTSRVAIDDVSISLLTDAASSVSGSGSTTTTATTGASDVVTIAGYTISKGKLIAAAAGFFLLLLLWAAVAGRR